MAGKFVHRRGKGRGHAPLSFRANGPSGVSRQRIGDGWSSGLTGWRAFVGPFSHGRGKVLLAALVILVLAVVLLATGAGWLR